MITGKEIYAPTTGQVNTPTPFHVDKYSQVVFLAPAAGETLTEDDSFQLRRVIEVDGAGAVVRSLPVVDSGGAVLLGANNTQAEVLIRGTYILSKILDTTESVGAYRNHGIEEAV